MIAKHTDTAPPSQDKKTPKSLFHLALPIIIVLLVAVFYIPAMRAGFIWDDDDYVTRNENLKSLAGLRKIWLNPGATYQYYPLVHTSFWVEYHLWKLHPFGYHLVNILIHASSAVILLLILRRLGLSWAWLAAAMFALHPVHVESVAWITERKNVLSGLFYLLSLLFYLRFIDPAFEPSESPSRKPMPYAWKNRALLRRFYIPALLFYLCALLSKTVASSLPVSILLLLWWKRKNIRWQDVLPLIPFFIFGGVMSFTTAKLEKVIVGAHGAKWDWSFIERCLIAGRALWFYAGKLLVPHPLSFIYPKWQIDAKEWAQYLYPLSALIVFIILGLLRHKTGRAPMAAVLFFIITLFPALGFFNVYPMLYSYVADHFQYLASIGLIALYAGLIASGLKRLFPANLKIQYGAAAVIPLALGVLSWRQAHIYKNLETLWMDTISRNPNAWLAHNNLGIILTDQGNADKAIRHFHEAIRINPEYEVAHYNLGYAFVQKGDLEKGIEEYQKAIRLSPDYVKAYINLGIALETQGAINQAIKIYYQALRISPKELWVTNQLAWIQATSKREDLRNASEAVRLGEMACRLTNDKQATIIDTLAAAYAEAGRFEEAIKTAEKALELARRSEEKNLSTDIEKRLQLYKSGNPYRE